MSRATERSSGGAATRREPPARVGIERIAAYPCQLALDFAELARARGRDPSYPRDDLFVATRSLNPPWEDPVTMAVAAAGRVLEDEDRDAVELVVVGTESSPDFGKPISTYVQRHTGIGVHCRAFETKHACYGGTSALMTAAHWVASGVRPGKKALVVATDQSRAHFGKPWEFVLGAGAVAMLVSDRPDVLELELGSSGYWTTEVADTYRPTHRTEVGNAGDSLYCYLEGLEGAYDHFLARVGEIDFDRYFQKNVYHAPFGAMTLRAHRALLRRHGESSSRAARDHFERRSAAALTYGAAFGGTYTASTFIGLMGLVDASDDLRPGDRVGIFSYGSGSCAEFYCGRVGERAKEIVAADRLRERLEARDVVSVVDYERIESWRHDHADAADYEVDRSGLRDVYSRRYEGCGRLVLAGVDGFRREYERS